MCLNDVYKVLYVWCLWGYIDHVTVQKETERASGTSLMRSENLEKNMHTWMNGEVVEHVLIQI